MSKIKHSQDLIEVGNLIKHRRDELRMTQEELGEKIDVSGNTIHRIESAHVSTGVDRLFQISDALRTTPDKLCPMRFLIEGENHDEVLHKISLLWKRLNTRNRDMAYSVILPLLTGLFDQQHR